MGMLQGLLARFRNTVWLFKRKNSRILKKLNQIWQLNSILIPKKLNENSETQFLDNLLAKPIQRSVQKKKSL